MARVDHPHTTCRLGAEKWDVKHKSHQVVKKFDLRSHFIRAVAVESDGMLATIRFLTQLRAGARSYLQRIVRGRRGHRRVVGGDGKRVLPQMVVRRTELQLCECVR